MATETLEERVAAVEREQREEAARKERERLAKAVPWYLKGVARPAKDYPNYQPRPGCHMTRCVGCAVPIEINTANVATAENTPQHPLTPYNGVACETCFPNPSKKQTQPAPTDRPAERMNPEERTRRLINNRNVPVEVQDTRSTEDKTVRRRSTL